MSIGRPQSNSYKNDCIKEKIQKVLEKEKTKYNKKEKVINRNKESLVYE